MKKYNLKIGLHVCLLVAVVSVVPRIIRLNSTEYMDIILSCFSTFVLLFVFWFIHHYVVLARPIKHPTLNGIMGIAACAVFSLVYHGLIELFFGRIDYLAELDVSRGKEIVILIFRGILLGTLLHLVVYYLHTLVEKQKVSMELEKVKQENLEARLNSLKQQISPHFLFNALSTLKTIASDAGTKDYVVQLANVYRYLLSYTENTTSPLKDELHFTRSYVYILEQRFEQGLHINITIDPLHLNRKIPPLTLQILIENAVRHNVVSIGRPLKILVTSTPDERLIVQNNLQPRISSSDGAGKGLLNISDRYRLLAQREIEIQKDDRHFTVLVPLI